MSLNSPTEREDWRCGEASTGGSVMLKRVVCMRTIVENTSQSSGDVDVFSDEICSPRSLKQRMASSPHSRERQRTITCWRRSLFRLGYYERVL